MSIRPQDVLLYGGGECLQRFGVPFWRMTRSQDVAATMARTGAAGSFVGKDGVLRQASADRLRVDWIDTDDDGILDTPALLAEAARTNELLRSEALDNASWSKSFTSIVADQADGPDGETSLDEIVESSDTGFHRVSQSVTVTADADYAFSGFFIANTRAWVRLLLTGGGGTASAYFNLSTGAVGTTGATGTGAFVRAYVEDWTDVVTGLYRCVLVGSVGDGDTSVTPSVNVQTQDDEGGYTGDGSSSLYAGYLQLEDGTPVASSYIPTTTAAVDRNADNLYAGFGHAPQGMTVYVKFVERGSRLVGGDVAVFHIGAANSATTPKVYMSAYSGGYQMRHNNGTTESQAQRSMSPSVGDTVELRGVLAADGSVTLGASVNAAAETTATDATAPDLQPAWAGTRFYLNSKGSTSPGLNAFAAVKVAAGVRTMAEMRSLFAYDSARAVQ